MMQFKMLKKERKLLSENTANLDTQKRVEVHPIIFVLFCLKYEAIEAKKI